MVTACGSIRSAEGTAAGAAFRVGAVVMGEVYASPQGNRGWQFLGNQDEIHTKALRTGTVRSVLLWLG